MLKEKGGALIIVLLLLTLFSLWAVYMITTTSTSLKTSDNALQGITVDFALCSAEHHARSLLFSDLFANAYDSFSDVWFVQSSSSNKFSKWFEIKSSEEGTVCRYRFNITAINPTPQSPLVRLTDKLIYTDDINASSKNELDKLIYCFDSSATNETKRKRITAKLIDDRDGNNYLSDKSEPDTEAITFEIIADKSDTRRIHFDDTMRLGRYYESRAAHNFFLIKESKLFYNSSLGRTNIIVKLDDKPMAFLPGWNEYSKMRKEAGLPMWHPGMWNNIIAVTGAGGNLKTQPVISNTTDSLIFDDDNYQRFMPTGTFRQTVTFVGWFSSLNELQIHKTRAAKEWGAIFTLTNGAPDGILITNVNAGSKYRMTLFTGNPLIKKQEASASFFGMDSLQKIEFSEEGIARFNNGKPATSHAYKNGNYLELIIRAPREGVSKRNPFFIDSAVLEQPEFITLYNNSAEAINIRGWRLGYKCGDYIFYSSPFTTSFYYSISSAKRVINTSPMIPAFSSLVLTEDLSLFDRFCGASANGIWGDNAQEKAPAIHLSDWGIKFKIKRITPQKTYYQKSTSNKNHPWETDWKIEIDGVDWSEKLSRLIGEITLFDADGEGEKFSPTPGVIVKQGKEFIVIRLAGSAKRFSFNEGATLKFVGLPDIVKEYYLLNREGKIVALMHKPRAQSAKKVPVMLKRIAGDNFEVNKIDWRTVIREIRKEKPTCRVVKNSEYKSFTEKFEVLNNLNISTSNDWYACDSLFLRFDESLIQPLGNINYARTDIKVRRIENGRCYFDSDDEFTFGAPGLFTDKIYIKGMPPFSINSFGKNFCELYLPNSFAVTQKINDVAVISPDGTSGGIHLFGAPGDIVFQWTNLPRVRSTVKLTLSARGTGEVFFPKNIFEEKSLSNSLLKISVFIWDEKKVKYIPLVKKKIIDASERLYLGKIPSKYFNDGRLRIKIRTYKTLSATRGALWLKGIYLHPFSGKKYININTEPDIISTCGGNTNLAKAILINRREKKVFKSIGEILSVMKRNKIKAGNKFTVRSEIFGINMEAEVADKQTKQAIARKYKKIVINRTDELHYDEM